MTFTTSIQNSVIRMNARNKQLKAFFANVNDVTSTINIFPRSIKGIDEINRCYGDCNFRMTVRKYLIYSTLMHYMQMFKMLAFHL